VTGRIQCSVLSDSETRERALMKVFGFAGYSGSGKTTLIEQLIPLFTAQGLRVSLVKHTHHGFDIDKPGKDSFRFREAGAQEVMLAGAQRWALMHELHDEAEPVLADLLAHMLPCDVVLVEGFRSVEIPKMEVHRPSTGHAFIHPVFPNVVAVASDERLDVPLPCLDLNDVAAIADFVKRFLQIESEMKC
jgi:molybdopterin-guanine dinucleotide biosynthesis protein B